MIQIVLNENCKFKTNNYQFIDHLNELEELLKYSTNFVSSVNLPLIFNEK
jgi:hypothetical protein